MKSLASICNRSVMGSALVSTLLMTVIVTSLMLAAGYRVAMDLRVGSDYRESHTARLHADAGVELAVRAIHDAPTWRGGAVDTWISTTVDGSTVDVALSDPRDGSVPIDGTAGSSDADTVWVAARAQRGEITRRIAAKCLPIPHQTLRFVGAGISSVLLYNVHVEGRVMGALSAQSALATLVGDAYVATGAITTPGLDDLDTDIIIDDNLPSLPDYDFNWFVDAGKEVLVPFFGSFSSFILNNTRNPYGLVSPEGIYWMDAAGADLRFTDCGIDACLVILNAGKISIESSGGDGTNYHHVSPEPQRLPAMIVDGDLTMSATGGEDTFQLLLGLDLVPFTRDIRGVFAATGTVKAPQVAGTGSLIVEGSFIGNAVQLRSAGSVTLLHDPALNNVPIVGIPGVGVRVLSRSSQEIG